MKYRVHRFDISMTRDQQRLEQFLNNLGGEVVSIIPNVTPFPANFVNFLLVVEKLQKAMPEQQRMLELAKRYIRGW